jgi:type VI secretion system protein VasG
MSINLKTLIGKLDDTCRAAATRAAGLCVSLGQYEVDIEHLFLALLEQPACDVAVIARRSGVSLERLETDLHAEVAGFRSGNTRTPVFSERLPKLFEHAWLIASLDLRAGQQASIRSGHLLQALLSSPELSQLAHRVSPLFAEFDVDRIKHHFDDLTAGSDEAPAIAAASARAAGDGGDPVGELRRQGPSKTPALDQFTTNLTQRARDGKVDPVIGRDAEIRQLIDILMRRRQNNPILTGEAGVGKTAVVEGLALRIATGDVPEVLRGVEIHVLDLGLLQAGASVKGEFENRLKNVIDEVKKSPHPIILFIDEAHTMIGAGGQAGQNDAANLLKPALARGELRTIAATTWSEYKKYFEKDAALARRFQVVKVEEPSEDLACAMLRGMAPLMEKHFNVRVSTKRSPKRCACRTATSAAASCPTRPSACSTPRARKWRWASDAAPARSKTSRASWNASTPNAPRWSASRRRARACTTRGWPNWRPRARRRRGATTGERPARALGPEKASATSVQRIREAADARGARRRQTVAELRPCRAPPMVPLQVDGHVVAEIVAGWTGIPLGKMVKDEIRRC